MSRRRIVVLGTGGTIAGRGANIGYKAGEVAVADLLAGIRVPPGIDVEAEQVAQIDSKDMDFAVWRSLVQRCAHWLAQDEVAGIVVTHGTDTMEETAFLLQSVLAPRKPVVLTGAMRPATATSADGPQNLADALAVAAAPGAHGACVVFAGAIHGPDDVHKAHPYRLDAFASGDAGPLGFVEEAQLRMLRAWPEGAALRTGALADPAQWPRVEIVLSHAGASGAIVEALVQQGVQGLVAAGTGNGTLHHALEAALVRAQQQGVRVVRSTRCAQGRVLSHGGEPLPVAEGLSPVKARIALMLALMS